MIHNIAVLPNWLYLYKNTFFAATSAQMLLGAALGVAALCCRYFLRQQTSLVKGSSVAALFKIAKKCCGSGLQNVYLKNQLIAEKC